MHRWGALTALVLGRPRHGKDGYIDHGADLAQQALMGQVAVDDVPYLAGVFVLLKQVCGVSFRPFILRSPMGAEPRYTMLRSLLLKMWFQRCSKV